MIYAGHGEVIAAPHTGGHVEYEPVPWFKDYFVGARRVIPGAAGVGMPAGEAMPARAAMPAPGAGRRPGRRRAPAGGCTVSAPARGRALTTAPGAGVAHRSVHAGHGADHVASLDGDPPTYPGDDASQRIAGGWRAAQKRGLPPQLPVMAALVESGVKNLPFGDRDSVGFFQMRMAIWNQGAYTGFPDHPSCR